MYTKPPPIPPPYPPLPQFGLTQVFFFEGIFMLFCEISFEKDLGKSIFGVILFFMGISAW
jgi:hypothetical protein